MLSSCLEASKLQFVNEMLERSPALSAFLSKQFHFRLMSSKQKNIGIAVICNRNIKTSYIQPILPRVPLTIFVAKKCSKFHTKL